MWLTSLYQRGSGQNWPNWLPISCKVDNSLKSLHAISVVFKLSDFPLKLRLPLYGKKGYSNSSLNKDSAQNGFRPLLCQNPPPYSACLSGNGAGAELTFKPLFFIKKIPYSYPAAPQTAGLIPIWFEFLGFALRLKAIKSYSGAVFPCKGGKRRSPL